MIVRPRPGLFGLLLVMRGSVLPQIAPRVAGVALLAVLVQGAARHWPGRVPDFGTGSFALLGVVLSIFLGFRNTACYDRWWEARRQWGALLLEVRSLARDSVALLPGPSGARVVRGAIGFAHALAERLRGTTGEGSLAWVPEAERAGLRPLRNRPEAMLRLMALELAGLLQTGALHPQLYQPFSERLAGMTAVQAACERIGNTPLPFAYTLLVHRTATLFCVLLPFGLYSTVGWGTPLAAAMLAYAFFGLDALGTELEAPFGDSPNALALDAMVRTMEIDLLEALGETALPEPLRAVGFVLR